MIKKASLMTALSVTAFSGWAQDSNSDTLVVTANRFQQPVNTVLAPTDVGHPRRYRSLAGEGFE